MPEKSRKKEKRNALKSLVFKAFHIQQTVTLRTDTGIKNSHRWGL
jgi:hypothetical protein